MRRPVITLVALVLVLAACGGDDAADQLSGFVRSPLPEVADLSLPDVANGGEPFAMSANAGGVLLVYFGYTSCPDVCPTTMADVRRVLRDLGPDGDRVEVAMATVDPGRDTEEVITGYVQTFIPGAHALRTEVDSELSAVAEAFGAAYEVTETAEGEIEVVHTGHLYAIDDRGRLRVTWPFGTTPADVRADIELLLGEYAS